MSCCPPVPECLPPQATLMFFPGTAGPAGPTGAASTVPGPAGPQGETAVGVYTGNYVSTTTYYDTDVRKDIVAYAGRFWITNNPVKSGSNTWEAPTVTDWTDFGATLTNVATALALIGAQSIAVPFTFGAPGLLQSANFVAGSVGWLLTAAGALQAYDSIINGLISTGTPKFNLASLTRTMPGVGFSAYTIGAIADINIPVNPLQIYSPDTSDNTNMVFYGWTQGANNFLENRFGNTSQKFLISVQGSGQNTSAGTDFIYIYLFYRTRTNGGGWDPVPTVVGGASYIQPGGAVDQTFLNTQSTTIALAGNQDVQFAVGFSKGAAGAGTIGAAYLTVLAFN